MPFIERNGLKYYQFDIFQGKAINHAVFTRRGGVSDAPWNSLNIGGSLGDERDNIIQNRELMFDAIERPVESLFDVWQVHGSRVIRADEPRNLNSEQQKADAIITNNPNITLLMRFADCTPILLYDPEKNAVGLVHAGWKGTVKKVVISAVKSMQREFGTIPSDIIAGIGPSIGPDHYEIGLDVFLAVQEAYPDCYNSILIKKNGGIFFNLWEANRLNLVQAGVRKLQNSGICTMCRNEDWFSHRGENGKTGRFGAMISLDNN
jgi:YfiH family protein